MREVRALLLAAGLGTRLRPLTSSCPKCLVPIGDKPLLEHWLCNLHHCGISEVLVNIHHHREMVETFLSREPFSGWVHGVVEDELLGTAGTLRNNHQFLDKSTVLLVHADNWIQADLVDFVEFHQHQRAPGTVMTMMTFQTDSPTSCGIIETDAKGVVRRFHEKVTNPPGNLANGAVYLLEPEVLNWVSQNPDVTDFSTEVIPKFLGRIATWENKGIHRDIGAINSLLIAQSDPQPESCWKQIDAWMESYLEHPVHEYLSNTRAKIQ